MSRKRGEEHEEHVNHEAWVIPYADMLTLLMGLFLMLYAMGNLDMAKFRELAASLRNEIGGESVAAADIGASGGAEELSIMEGGGAGWPIDGLLAGLTQEDERLQGARALAEEREEAEQAEEAAEQLGEVEAVIEQAAAQLGFPGRVQFRQEARGLVVTIVTDQVLFAPGAADIQAAGADLLRSLQGLTTIPNQLQIEGHTDSSPISTARYPSNWQLSADRAFSVREFMISALGIPAERIASVAGFADTKPIADNATPQGRAANRRVEVVVLSQAPGAQGGG